MQQCQQETRYTLVLWTAEAGTDLRLPTDIDREFGFYEFFSFLKFNEFYEFFFG